MFAARSARASMRAAAQALRQRAFSTRSNVHSPRAVGALAAVAGITGAAALMWHQTRLSCESASAAAAAPALPVANPSGAAGSMTLGLYNRRSNRLDGLTQADIESQSLEELAKRYDPAVKDKDSLLYDIVWGAPPPPNGLPALPLLFTASDPDPFHRHMELVVRSIQDRICTDLIDIEHREEQKVLGTPGAPATLKDIEGQELTPRMREMLLSQTDKASDFPERIVLRPGFGGGSERVMAGGRVFSKAGVNVTIMNVERPADSFLKLVDDHPSLQGIPVPDTFKLFTASVSLVLHPVSPHVPTCHANYRFFDLLMPDGKRVQWFGGGSDLTPTYVVDEDAKWFHKNLRRALDPIDPTIYPAWKKWCDKYFFIAHRGESRGVGGVFYDDQHTRPREQYERITRALGESFSAGYFPIVLKRLSQPFNEKELAFQQIRRGRYTEFNLVYDKGTTYGLRQPNARVDAILMSMPPLARFAYRRPIEDKREIYTEDVLKNPKDW